MTWDTTNRNLASRTPGESLWLARKAAGFTQVEAASLAGVARDAYVDAEADRKELPPHALGRLRRYARGVGRPSRARLLALARRRSGIGLARLAAALSISRVTVLAWERAGNVVLRAFWEKRGYTFGR